MRSLHRRSTWRRNAARWGNSASNLPVAASFRFSNPYARIRIRAAFPGTGLEEAQRFSSYTRGVSERQKCAARRYFFLDMPSPGNKAVRAPQSPGIKAFSEAAARRLPPGRQAPPWSDRKGVSIMARSSQGGGLGASAIPCWGRDRRGHRSGRCRLRRGSPRTAPRSASARSRPDSRDDASPRSEYTSTDSP